MSLLIEFVTPYIGNPILQSDSSEPLGNGLHTGAYIMNMDAPER